MSTEQEPTAPPQPPLPVQAAPVLHSTGARRRGAGGQMGHERPRCLLFKPLYGF